MYRSWYGHQGAVIHDIFRILLDRTGHKVLDRESPFQVEIIHRIRRIHIVVLHPAFHRVDAEEPAELGDVGPGAHLDGLEHHGAFGELLVLADPGEGGLAGGVVGFGSTQDFAEGAV